MTIHGFRVYRIELLERQGRKPVPWDLGGAGNYRDHITGIFSSLTAGSPAPLLAARRKWVDIDTMDVIYPATAVATGDRCVRFVGAVRNGRRVSVRLMYGVGGNFTHSIGPAGDTPFNDQAAAREYRAEIVVPDNPDQPGLLALETISRSAPINAVVFWLAAASKVSQLQRGSSDWWRLKQRQVSDSDYLDELIERTERAEVTLKRVGRDAVGSRQQSYYTLKAPLSLGSRRDARNWAKQSTRSEHGLLEIIGISDPGDMEFNQGFLSLDDGETTTRIGVSDARDTFTYPISDERPDQSTWNTKVRARLRRIAPDLQWE